MDAKLSKKDEQERHETRDMLSQQAMLLSTAHDLLHKGNQLHRRLTKRKIFQRSSNIDLFSLVDEKILQNVDGKGS